MTSTEYQNRTFVATTSETGWCPGTVDVRRGPREDKNIHTMFLEDGRLKVKGVFSDKMKTKLIFRKEKDQSFVCELSRTLSVSRPWEPNRVRGHHC